MAKHQIPTDDLYAVGKSIQKTLQGKDGCHFTGEGYKVLGRAVAQCIIEQLGLDPLPEPEKK